ncbi:MAG: hypothetical protein ACXWC9_02605 [Pseudobdellovibrionaceae bacterium]
MKNLMKALFKKKAAALVAMLGAFLINYSQTKMGLSPIASEDLASTAISFSADEALPAYQLETASYALDSSCDVFPATAEVNSEVDLFADKVGRLQEGYMIQSASNLHYACANSAAGKAARAKFPTIGFPQSQCRNNHQAQLQALQSTKAHYYERFVALSKEPACAGLLSMTEGRSTGFQPQITAMSSGLVDSSFATGTR